MKFSPLPIEEYQRVAHFPPKNLNGVAMKFVGKAQVLINLKAQARTGGKVYVSVRNDKKALNGATSKGTWQGDIPNSELESKGIFLVKSTSNFRMFKYSKR